MIAIQLPSSYFLEEALDGTRMLCENSPVYRIVPNGVEPQIEYRVRRVARIPKGTLISEIKEIAELDNRSREKTRPWGERGKALRTLAKRFGAAKL